MSARKIHDDWPEFEITTGGILPDPVSHLAEALRLGEQMYAEARERYVEPERRISIGDVRTIVAQWIAYDDGPSSDGRHFVLDVVGRTFDGRWFGVEASNDPAGWGSLAGSQIKVGETIGQVEIYGLGPDGWERLNEQIDAVVAAGGAS